ncbi:uncharacterized protein [Temnothorax longispinosus]|uniref:uncharacterized protein n=1 Tax=Temnothorax longispinosus TaxID=300112 RepID=UPI003A99C7CA
MRPDNPVLRGGEGGLAEASGPGGATLGIIGATCLTNSARCASDFSVRPMTVRITDLTNGYCNDGAIMRYRGEDDDDEDEDEDNGILGHGVQRASRRLVPPRKITGILICVYDERRRG